MSTGGSRFDIKPWMLNEAGSAMAGVVFDMDEALTNLRQGLDSIKSLDGTPPWGTDELGVEVGRHYANAEANVFPAVESYRRQIEYEARALNTTGDNYAALDAGGKQVMDGLTVRLDEGRP